MKILRYIFAIPGGVLASVLLPVVYSSILKIFIPFEVVNNLLDTYFIPFISGFIAVGIAYNVAPGYRIIFGSVMLLLCLLASLFYSEGDFNYLFFAGSVIAFITTFLNGK